MPLLLGAFGEKRFLHYDDMLFKWCFALSCEDELRHHVSQCGVVDNMLDGTLDVDIFWVNPHWAGNLDVRDVYGGVVNDTLNLESMVSMRCDSDGKSGWGVQCFLLMW